MFNFSKTWVMKSLIIIVSSCIFFLGCKSQANKPAAKKNNDNNTLLWQVSGKDLKKPSYIFGTFHLLCKDDIKFSEQLKKSVTAFFKIVSFVCTSRF